MVGSCSRDDGAPAEAHRGFAPEVTAWISFCRLVVAGGYQMRGTFGLVQLCGGCGAILLLVLGGCTSPGTANGALLEVFQGGTEVQPGTSYDFGSEAEYITLTTDFTVKNVGTGTLTLDSSTPYSISGTNATDFSASGSGGASLGPGASAAFSVQFTPSTIGAETAMAVVKSDQGNQSFNLSGTGAPSGGVQLAWGTDGSTFQNSISNGSTSVGYTHVYSTDGWPQVYYFQISNTSSSQPLGIGTVSVTTATGTAFSVNSTPSPSVPASGAETFQIEAAYLGGGKTYTETVTMKTSSTTTSDQTFSFTVTDFQS